MATIVGIFDTQPQAETALIRLREAGFRDDSLALVANAPPGTGADEVAPADAALAETAPTEDAADAADTTRPIETSGERAEDVTTGAALGAAIGVIAGGGLLGPAGALLGAA